MRNRLVSGFSQGVVVVESDANGGSMITARFGAEQGRQVFAVPGRVDQAASRGCHELIRDGAVLCRDADDVLEELSYLTGMAPSADRAEEPGKTASLPEEEQAVVTLLVERGPLGLDALAEYTGRGVGEISPILLLLELKKLVVKRLDGSFEASFGA